MGASRQGYPNIRTVDYWLGGDKAERYPQSRHAPLKQVVQNLRTHIENVQDKLQSQQGRWLRAQNRGALDPFTHSSRVSLRSSLDSALLAAVPDGELQACVRHREVSASGLIVRDWRRPDSPWAFGNAPVTSITRKSCRRRLWRPPTGSGGEIGRAEARSHEPVQNNCLLCQASAYQRSRVVESPRLVVLTRRFLCGRAHRRRLALCYMVAGDQHSP